jgi:hypothetical protein
VCGLCRCLVGGGGGVPVESHGRFFMCIMCLGVWLAIECDAVGGGRMCEFYNNFKCTYLEFL